MYTRLPHVVHFQTEENPRKTKFNKSSAIMDYGLVQHYLHTKPLF